jgi:predicted RNA-binding protein with PUA-like domain
MKYWLVKSEPESYSFEQLQKDGKTIWDGVRNFQARNNLRDMKLGDRVLYYHSGKEKAVVGLAQVAKEHYPEPGCDDPSWLVVELKPELKFKQVVSLQQLKSAPDLADLALIKQSRLSVMPIKEIEFDKILELSGVKL